jgi:hypothetical protein
LREEAAMHYRIEHEFDCDPKTYWEVFFDDDYNKDLYAALKMKEWKVVEKREEGNDLRRVLRVTPQRNIPAILQKVGVGDLTYESHEHFHRDRSVMDIDIRMGGALGKKFEMKATYSVVPSGPEGSKCKRIFEGDIKVGIMLVGGQIEKMTVEDLKASYDVSTEVTRRWIAKRKQQPAT